MFRLALSVSNVRSLYMWLSFIMMCGVYVSLGFLKIVEMYKYERLYKLILIYKIICVILASNVQLVDSIQ